jgi:hypothetical protein
MENKNQIIRRYLEKLSKNGIITFSIPESLENLKLKDKIFYIMIEEVTFIDLYKQINYQIQTQNLTENDLKILPWIDGIYEFKDIHTSIIKNPLILEYLLDSSYNFYNACILEKLAQIKALPCEDKEFLLEICPSFIEDLNMYDIKIELENYYKYFMGIDNFYNKQDSLYFHETTLSQIAAFIKSLYIYDNENSIDNILKLAYIDYSYSKFLLNKDEYPDIANGRRKALMRINLYEEASERQIVEYAILDEYYLKELLDTYIFGRECYTEKEAFKEKVKCLLPDDINETAKLKIKKITDKWK